MYGFVSLKTTHNFSFVEFQKLEKMPGVSSFFRLIEEIGTSLKSSLIPYDGTEKLEYE
jgi:hypothetical protein